MLASRGWDATALRRSVRTQKRTVDSRTGRAFALLPFLVGTHAMGSAGEAEPAILDPYQEPDARLNAMRALDLCHQRRRLVDHAARRNQGEILSDDVREAG